MKARYVRADDDYAPGALNVTGSAEDPAYPAINAVSDNPAKPAKLTTTTGWILLEFANKIQPVGAAIIYHYLLAGLNVRVQASATSDFSSPAVNVAFSIPAKRKDGPPDQRWTINPWVLIGDLPDPTGYKFWRFIVVGTNDQNVIIGKVMLFSAIYAVDILHEAGRITETDYDEFSMIRDRTELGVNKRQTLGGPRRALTFGLVATDLAAGTPPTQDAADFRALLQAAEGDAHPWLFIPWDTNDALLVDTETPEWERSHDVGGYQIWMVSVREVARGVPWP